MRLKLLSMRIKPLADAEQFQVDIFSFNKHTQFNFNGILLNV